MFSRMKCAPRCAAIFFVLFGGVFCTALLLEPTLPGTYWLDLATYAAGVSLTAMLLDMVLNLRGGKALFPSMLLPSELPHAWPAESSEWEVLQQRNALLEARLQCDQPCILLHTETCAGWPFCGVDQALISASSTVDRSAPTNPVRVVDAKSVRTNDEMPSLLRAKVSD